MKAGNFSNITNSLVGWVVIIVTLALGPTIYTANSAILAWTTSITDGTLLISDFTALEVVVGFGGFIIILGLLVSGGIFGVAGLKGRIAMNGWKDLMGIIGAVVIIILTLTVFVNILDWFDQLIVAAQTASDPIGEVVFKIVPVLIYSVILAGAAGGQYLSYRRMSKKGSSKRKKRASLAYA